MITIALAGDVMLGRGVNEALRAEPDPRSPWGDVLPLLEDADLRLCNLECAITEHRRPWQRTYKLFHFRADPPAAAALKAARFDAVSLANNHVLDFEEAGLFDTFENLDRVQVGRAGAGRNLAEARRPEWLDAADRRVALLAYTDNAPEFSAGPDRPGTRFLPVSLDPAVLGEVEEDIRRARELADLVVVSNHWGPNMGARPKPLFRDFAHAVVDRGADVYFGHSAHVFQGVELYRGRPILYDAGDFLDDYAVDPALRNDESFLFRALFSRQGFEGMELIPVLLGYAEVHLARGGERDRILERMERRSAELGTRLARRRDRLWLANEEASRAR